MELLKRKFCLFLFYFFGVNNYCNKHVILKLPRHVRKAWLGEAKTYLRGRERERAFYAGL